MTTTTTETPTAALQRRADCASLRRVVECRYVYPALRPYHADAVSALLELGAAPDASDDAGKTAFDVAKAWGFTEAAAVLLDAGSSVSIDSPGPESSTDKSGEMPHRMRMPDNLQPEKLEL